MDDDTSPDLQKCLNESPMDTDEGPLINENSNGLSHLLTENEFNSVDAVVVDESSVSNQGFLNAVELSTGSVGDYLENNAESFGPDSFDVGDNAVTFASDSLNNVLSDGDSRLSENAYKHLASDTDGDNDGKTETDFANEISNDVDFSMSADDSMLAKTDDDKNIITETEDTMNEVDHQPNQTDIGEDSVLSNIDENKALNVVNSSALEEDISHGEVVSNIEKDIVNTKEDSADNSTTIVGISEHLPEKLGQEESENNKEKKSEKDSSEEHSEKSEMDTDKSEKDDEKAEMDIDKSEKDDKKAEIDSKTSENNVEKLEMDTKTPVKDDEKSEKDTEKSEEVNEKSEKHLEQKDKDEGIEHEVAQTTEKPQVGCAEETEIVSEDELPAVQKPSIKDAENVSDDELPGPKPAELPADTEVLQVVSEDELPASKKKTQKTEKPQVGCAEETEVVSEDELPAVQKPSIKDAENVSDDEMPGPKPAELPADTEVVSEDELPASKKDTKESRKRKPGEDGDGYDPGSPTSEPESASKKQAVAKNGESKPIPAEKRTSVDEKPKKKALPELDKYWKVVNDDPTDFTGWTYLLQYVDQESDVEAAREAYDAFLSHYPYCYGYWRKYADYEKRKGSKKKCLEVLERGLKAIPLSVDLWIHYLNHVKTTRTEDHIYIRSQYERAIEACGLEFRSDRLWESYIKWEAENGSALNVTNIYDRLLATPTLGYTSHFDNFQEHVMSEPVAGVISRDELVRLRGEVREAAGTTPPLDLPPGEDEPLDHIASDEEAQAIKERIIAARRKIHKTTGEEVAARWTYEEGIKRPYFHVKPLERCQLKNWKLYLDWEKQHGSLKRALVLHERCLIACALYDEFWMRLVKFLEEKSKEDPTLVAVEREVLERACTVHHQNKPELHLHWAHFEEAHGNHAKAADILDRIEKRCPNILNIQYRRVNLERRRGDLEKCAQLYENYISSAKSKAVASALAIKYARFQYHVRRDPDAARKVLDEAITKDPLNARLHMQRLDLALHTPDTPFEVLEELSQSYEKQEGAEVETCAALAWRRRELAEELGPAEAARAAHAHARALAKQLRKRTRKDRAEPPPLPATETTKKKETSTPAAASTVSTANNSSSYYQAPAAAPQNYDQSYAQTYQPPPWGYQQPPGPYQHHPGHPWPQYTNYY